METTYSRAVGLAIPVFFLLIAAEFVADRMRDTRYYRLADTLNSLSCGILSTGMRVFFGFLGLFAYEWVLRRVALVHLPAAHWGTWVFAFVLYDFCYYWQHRFGHTMGLFWASHVVHHQSEEFNLTTALRQPATGAFTNWIFYVPMALAGVPVAVFLMVGVIQLFYQFWPHTRHIGRLGFLDRWIQTPSNHRVHHAQNDLYLDKNYVGVFTFWDRLFGTFQDELDEDPPIYGIRGQLRSWNPVWANLHYYWAMALDSWHAQSWRDKLYVWIAPPGWRPADVAARWPKPHYDPRHDFELYDPSRSASLSWYCLAQIAALVVADQRFLTAIEHQGVALNVLRFGPILAGLVSIGGLLENREFLWVEAGRLVLSAAIAGATGSGPITAWAAMSLIFICAMLRRPRPAEAFEPTGSGSR